MSAAGGSSIEDDMSVMDGGSAKSFGINITKFVPWVMLMRMMPVNIPETRCKSKTQRGFENKCIDS